MFKSLIYLSRLSDCDPDCKSSNRERWPASGFIRRPRKAPLEWRPWKASLVKLFATNAIRRNSPGPNDSLDFECSPVGPGNLSQVIFSHNRIRPILAFLSAWGNQLVNLVISWPCVIFFLSFLWKLLGQTSSGGKRGRFWVAWKWGFNFWNTKKGRS